MSTTQEPEVRVLPRKGLGKSLLESSNGEGKCISRPQPIFLRGFRTDVMASNKLSGPVHS